MPIQAQLHDGRILEFPDGTNPQVIQATVKRVLGVPPSTERTWGEAAGDVGAAAIRGTGQVLQFPGELVGLVPGLRGFGEALATPGEFIAGFGERLKSSGLKAREALRNQALSEAEKEGVLAEFATAIKETIKDPALLSTFLTEQVPQLLGPGAAVKLVKSLGREAVEATAQGVAREAAEKALKERAAAAGVGTGVAMQGADVGNDTYKAVYDLAIKQGMSEEEARALAASKARIAAAEAAAISLATARLPGGSAIERRMAGLPGGSRVGAGLRETGTESIEEAGGAFAKGVGMAEVDPSISPLTGVGTAAGFGALGGLGLGTVVGGAPVKPPGAEPSTGELAPIDVRRQEAARAEAEKAAKAAKAAPPPVPSTQAIIDETLTKPVSQASAQLTLAIEQLKQQPASPQRNAAIKELDDELKRREREDAERVQAGKRRAEGFLTAGQAAAQGVTPREEFDPTQARREEIERLRERRESMLVKGKPPARKSPARREFDELDARLVEIGGGRWTPPTTPTVEEPSATVGLTEQDLFNLGIDKRQPIFKRLLGKDPSEGSVLDDIQDYLTKGHGSEESRTKLTEFRNQFMPKPPEAAAPTPPETPSASNVPTESEPSGAGVPVAGGPAAVSPTQGTGAAGAVRVVPPVENAGQPAAGEGQQPPAVAPPAPAPSGNNTPESDALMDEIRELQKQQQALLTKAGRAPAVNSPARKKWDELGEQIASKKAQWAEMTRAPAPAPAPKAAAPAPTPAAPAPAPKAAAPAPTPAAPAPAPKAATPAPVPAPKAATPAPAPASKKFQYKNAGSGDPHLRFSDGKNSYELSNAGGKPQFIVHLSNRDGYVFYHEGKKYDPRRNVLGADEISSFLPNLPDPLVKAIQNWLASPHANMPQGMELGQKIADALNDLTSAPAPAPKAAAPAPAAPAPAPKAAAPAPAPAPQVKLTPNQRAELAQRIDQIADRIPQKEYDDFVDNHLNDSGTKVRPGAEHIQAALDLLKKYGPAEKPAEPPKPPKAVKPAEPPKAVKPAEPPKPPAPPARTLPQPKFRQTRFEEASLLNSQEMDDALRGASFTEALDYAIENARDDLDRAVMVKVKRRAEELVNLGVEFSFELTPRGVTLSGARGVATTSFAGLGESLKVNVKINGYTGSTNNTLRQETLVHEMIHAVTVAQIRYAPQSSAAMKLKALQKELLSKYKQQEKNSQLDARKKQVLRNALEDPYELITYGLVNADVQNWLASTPSPTGGTFLGRFFDLVSQILNLKGKETSALAELMTISESILDESLQLTVEEANKQYASFGKQPNTTGFPSWVLRHGLKPAWVDGPTGNVALVESVSKYGVPVYLGVNKNGNKITFVDVRDYTGTAFTQSELQRLKTAANNLANAAKQSGSTPSTSSTTGPTDTEIEYFDAVTPQTEAFERWFDGSKVVDEDGEPLVVYHGTLKDFSTFSKVADSEFGYGYYFATNPNNAEAWGSRHFTQNLDGSFSKPTEGLNIMPVYLAVRNPASFRDVQAAKKYLGKDWTPQQLTSELQDRGFDGVWSKQDDELVVFDRKQIKSATGNVGAYGQRPITEEEARSLGMTEAEAAEAQAIGDIRLDAVTPQTEAATAGVNAIGKESKKSLADFLRRNPALAARIKATDYLAGLDDIFTKAYAGKVRDATGNLNPMVLISRALDHGRVSLEAMRTGGLKIKDGLVQAAELTVPEDSKEFPLVAGKTISYQKDVIERLAKEAEKAGTTYEKYRTQVDTVLYGHREYYLREHNREVEKQALALEAAGKTKEADQLREDQTIELLIKDDAKLDALEAEFQRNKDIQEISQTLDAIRFNNLDVLVETNRLSPEKAQEYKDNIGYIPFKRIVEYEAGFDTARGGNRGIAALKNIRNLEGSSRESLSVIENFAGFMDWSTREAMLNSASLSALKDMELLKLAKKGANNEVGATGANVKVYDKGEKVEYYVPDPAHVIAFTFQPPELSSVFKKMQTASNILRAGVTSMPPFAVKQIFDDIARAYAYSGVKNPMQLTARILTSFPANWYREAFGKKQNATVREMAKLGIFGTFDFTKGGNLRDILQEAGAEGRSIGKTIMRFMEAGAKASDVSVRQAIYEQVLKETGDAAAAESRAREIINFSRRGASNFMNTMIAIVPFFNAYARGMDKLAVAGAGKVVGQSAGQARSMFYKRMATMTAMGIVYALMMSDDDEYNALPDHVRDTNWILPYGKDLGFTPGIPIPAELAFFFKAIPERVVRYYKLQGTDEEKAAIDVVGNLLKRGVDVFSSPNVTAQLLRPFVENITNYSWFLGRPLESQGQLALDPFQRFGTGTSDTAKEAAKKLEDLYQTTGVELFRVSPIKIENAIRGILGTTAGVALAISDAFINPTRTDRPLHQMLAAQLTGASAVMKDPVGTRYLDEVYDLEKDVNRVNSTYNRMLEREPENADEYLRKNVGLFSIRPAVSSLMKTIKELNDEAALVDRTTEISRAERRTLINQLRAQQNQIAQQVGLLRTQARKIQQGM